LSFLWLIFLMFTKHGKVGKMVSRNSFSWKQTRHWLCLFSGKWFSGNHFPNFHMFVYH
jgi:hypothetical protein